MNRIEIIVNGKAYPCTPSMGAMLRFKQETEREITQIDAASFSDLCTYLWCCIVSGSRREGLDFNYSLMEFADFVTPDDMREWSAAVLKKPDASDSSAGGDQKKRP